MCIILRKNNTENDNTEEIKTPKESKECGRQARSATNRGKEEERKDKKIGKDGEREKEFEKNEKQ